MSDMMMGGLPPTIDVPSQEPPQGGGDSISLVKQAQDLLRQALQNEPDEQDSLLLEDVLTKTQKYIADQEKLVDTATGAGPGARLVRKAEKGGSVGGGY